MVIWALSDKKSSKNISKIAKKSRKFFLRDIGITPFSFLIFRFIQTLLHLYYQKRLIWPLLSSCNGTDNIIEDVKGSFFSFFGVLELLFGS